MDDYTDYNRYSWEAVKPIPSSLLVLAYRLPWYVLMFSIVYFAYTTKFLSILDPSARIAITVIITVCTLVIITVLHLILNHIDKSRGAQLVSYLVDRQGIHVDHHCYPHSKQLKLTYPNEAVREKAMATLAHYRSET